MDKDTLSGLRCLVDAYDSSQKTRIQLGNRVSAIVRGSDTADEFARKTLEESFAKFEMIEKDLAKSIVEASKEIEIVQAAVNVKGIGHLLVSRIVSMIDIEIDDTVSSLWKYAGYAVDEDGRGQGLRRGQKATYNVALKTACYRLASSLIKCNSPYKEIYDEAKQEYLNRDWTKMHAHTAAIRKMTKIFLQHIWIVWRTLEGLPVSKPYIHDVGGHTHYITPEQMGWPPISV